ncbi:hypothetical protein [Mycoplasmopsis iners]|uniref:hypothetical protein n=1 Tax=Mycoplasmopsis iners TaxID=76630 RepID=UPI0004974573|nr:hypothetical protein [Mycoplasmopsis iners]
MNYIKYFAEKANNSSVEATSDFQHFSYMSYIFVSVMFIAFLIYGIYKYHMNYYLKLIKKYEKVNTLTINKLKKINFVFFAICISLPIIAMIVLGSVYAAGLLEQLSWLAILLIGVLNLIEIGFSVYQLWSTLITIRSFTVDNNIDFDELKSVNIMNLDPDNISIKDVMFANQASFKTVPFSVFFYKKFKNIAKLDNNKVLTKILTNAHFWGANLEIEQSTDTPVQKYPLFILGMSFQLLVKLNRFKSYEECLESFQAKFPNK